MADLHLRYALAAWRENVLRRVAPTSKDEAAGYFIDHMRDDVALIRVELVSPDEPGVREYARSPVSPFDPLMARRRLDEDEDAR